MKKQRNIISNYLQKRRLHRYWAVFVLLLSAIVAGGVYINLTEPVNTMTVICGQEEHTHSDSCYTTKLTCTNADEDHVHGDGCYTDQLTCGKKEHVHVDACYSSSETKDSGAEVVAANKEAPADETVTSQEDNATPETVTDVNSTAISEDATEVFSGETTDTSETVPEAAVPQIAGLTPSPALGKAGQAVSFSFTAENATKLSYIIVLGDDEVAAGALDADARALSWTPHAAGKYALVLTAVDADGAEETARCAFETVEVETLVAHADTERRSCFAGDTVHFDVRSEGGLAPVALNVRVLQGDKVLYEGSAAEAGVDITTSASDVVTALAIEVTATDALSDTAVARAEIPCAVRKVETSADWKKSVSTAKLGDEWPENLVAVAETQVGYAESAVNFIIDEAGEAHAWTRYGEFMGKPYEEWSAMYVSFCLKYANIPESYFPREADSARFAAALKSSNLFSASAEPQAGDLVFFDQDHDGSIDRVGIIAAVQGSTLRTYEGACEKAVASRTHQLGDRDIVGFGLLNRAYEQYLAKQTRSFTYTGEGFTAKVTCSGLARLPKNAALVVKEAAATDTYNEAIVETLGGESPDALAATRVFAVSFTADGEAVQAKDAVVVEIHFDEGLAFSEETAVKGFRVVGDVVEAYDVKLETADGVLTGISFKADPYVSYGAAILASTTAEEDAEAEENTPEENEVGSDEANESSEENTDVLTETPAETGDASEDVTSPEAGDEQSVEGEGSETETTPDETADTDGEDALPTDEEDENVSDPSETEDGDAETDAKLPDDDTVTEYSAEISFADAEAPLSLLDLLTEANAEAALTDDLHLTYDTELLSIEEVDGDYLFTPLADFARTVLTAEAADVRYTLELTDWAEPEAPAMLEGTRSVSVADADYTLHIVVPESAKLPANATFAAAAVTENAEKYIAKALEAVAGDASTTDYKVLALFDLTIYNDKNEVIGPAEPLQVGVNLGDALPGDAEVAVVHFPGTGAQPSPAKTEAPALDTKSALNLKGGAKKLLGAKDAPQATDSSAALTTETLNATCESGLVKFSTGSFSVYAIVGEGDTSDHARMTVEFYNGDDLIASMYVKNGDTLEELETILYDPGAGTVPEGKMFKGWSIEKKDYTFEDLANAKDIEQVRQWAAEKSITENETVKLYAMFYKTYTITYLDENGVSLGSDSVMLADTETSQAYTLNMAYEPKDDEHAFQGWNVSVGGDCIQGYTPGTVYDNGTGINVSGDVTFSVNAPEGHWLVFNENGKGATYNAPVFVKSDDVTAEPALDMKRNGYRFGGWYKAVSGTADENGYTPVDESQPFTFGGTLDSKTTLYAKWTPNDQSNYTVLIWKQNVEATGYDFEESISLTGPTNSFINTVTQQGTGNNAYARVNGTNKQYEGYYLKEFDQNVTITPEGDAILNVYYDRIQYTLRFYYARSYTYGGRTYVQVNCNDEGFLQGRAGRRNVYQSLTTIARNDYGFFSGGNTWKDVNANGLNGDATKLITDSYKQKVTLGSENIGNYNTYVVTSSHNGENNNNATNHSVNMTYYYFDINVYYGESVVDVWPVPSSETYNIYKGSGYNTRSNWDGQPATGIGLDIRPIHQGFWATGNGVSGLYSTVDPEMFVGDSSTAYFITYWRFQDAYQVTYNSYFSVLEDETPDVYYHGKGYKLHETFTALTGEPWQKSGRATDNKKGWDIGTVTYDGTRYASGNGYVGRLDGQNPNVINAYYDRVVNHIIYNDGIYVDGNGNPLQNRNTQQLHTQAVVFGSDLSSYNKGQTNYWRPDDTDEFIFEGWYLDSEGQHPYTFEGTMPEEDITVYAKWRQKQYRVFLHPNADNDTTLDWGSSSQAMNFRVAYGNKISTPTGRRSEYEFVGWYTDPSLSPSSLFNADVTELNSTTVTAHYDKTVDMTDPMDKWGNLGANPYNSDITGNNGGDRYWITEKLDLYAKWRAKLVGADGIHVVYDPNGGTNPPEDASLYLDTAEATVQAAPTAPQDKVFQYWVLQTWDEAQQKYVDTNRVYNPGDPFAVLKTDARVDENPGHTPENPSYTYTVQLRAEYTDSEAVNPTYIHFYANTQDKDGNAIDGVTAAPDGNEPKDITTYDNIQINDAKDILSIAQVLNGSTLYHGFTFEGWAKTRDASEPWLKLNADGTTYTVVQDGNTYNSVTQIAADEREPMEDLYAVWARKTYTVTVVKVAEEAYQNEPFKFTPTGVSTEDFYLVGNPDGATVDTTAYGHTKVYENVPYGTQFSFTEDAEYYDIAVTYTVTGTDDAAKNVTGQASSNGASLKVDGNTTVTFTNTRKTHPIKVFKHDAADPAKGLKGAVFTLSMADGTQLENLTTNEDGYLVFASDGTTEQLVVNLPADPAPYTLVELAPPAGYNMPTDNRKVFTVSPTGVFGGTAGEDGVYVIQVANSAGVSLPSTGSTGALPYTLSGLALMVLAAALAARRLRRY